MNKLLAGCGLATAALLFAFACSDSGETEQPGTAAESRPFSEWSMGCESQQGGSQQQQQQVPYKHPEQQGCSKQSVQFPKTGISDFHFDLDCDSRKVNVTQLGTGSAASGRAALRIESFPMQQDDSFKGQMSYQEKLPNDGKGNVSCWVEYVVIFDGQCGCERKEDGSWAKSVDVQSTVALQQADPSILGGGPSPRPSGSPSPGPSPSVSPSPDPSDSPSPSPSPSASPSPRPTPTIVPVVVCVVDDNACPWVGDGHMKCD